MNFWKALGYPFGERGWPHKLGIALLVAAIPVVGYFIIKGWEYEISVRVRRRALHRLPGWGNLPDKLARGLLIRLAGFVYNIPAIGLFGVVLALWVERIVTLFGPQVQTWQDAGQVLASGLGLRLALMLAAALAWVLADVLFWPGYIRYIDTQDFLAFFDVLDNVRLAFRNVFDDLLMALFVALLSLIMWAVTGLLSSALAATGVGALLAPVIGPALTFTVLSTFKGYLFGQLAINTLEAGR